MYSGVGAYSDPTQGDSSSSSWEDLARSGVNLLWAGSNPRSGGADPCCPPGYNPSGTWPRNSNVDGAPPDYRTRGAPMENASPSGVGRLKDDFCDCIPIRVGGKFYVLGEVHADGKVYTGPPEDRDNAVWVQVNPTTGRVISVPGIGGVSSGGGGGGVTPGGDGGAITTPPTLSNVVGGLALLGGLLFAATKRARGR